MNTTPAPQDTGQWINFLADKQLPVRVSTLARLQKKFAQGDASLLEMSKLIKADPILCLHVASLAGKLHREKNSQVTSIDHAISSLGMNRLEQLIGTLPAIKLSASSVGHKMYFRSVANSHHAATQTREWLIQARSGMFAEESFLAALFYGVGHWALWLMAPLHMSEIQVRVREQGSDPEYAEEQVLGCTVANISKELVARWQLSPLALATLEQDSPLNRRMLTQLHQRALGDPRLQEDELRALNHLTQQKFFPVKLANWLAWTTPFGWQTDLTLHVVDIINDYLRGQLAATMATVHKNCALSARHYHVAGTLSPAAEMLMLPSALHSGYKLTASEQQRCMQNSPTVPRPPRQTPDLTCGDAATTPLQPALPAEPLKPILQDPELFEQLSDKLLKHGDQYTQASDAISDLLRAISLGLGLTRCCVNVINTQNRNLQVIQAQGFPPGHPLPNSRHTLAADSLFLRLYEKSTCLRVKQADRARLNAALPDSYSRQIGTGSCLILSLFVRSRPLAIIYADAGEQAGDIHGFHQEKFKYLCAAAGTCLTSLAKPKQAGTRP